MQNDRYRLFFETEEYKKYNGLLINKIPLYEKGEFKVKFITSPAPVKKHYDFYQYDSEGYEDEDEAGVNINRFMTLTTLRDHSDQGGELLCLAVDITKKACPVYIFDGHESVFENCLAESLNKFLEMLYGDNMYS